MPPVTILSPYSGRPVVVREQDLNRAIRDEEGRIFYVVDDEEHGRYASRTRKGSEKDLERYRKMQSQQAQHDASPSVQASRSAQVHDATGTKRRNPVGMLTMLLIFLLIAAGLYSLYAFTDIFSDAVNPLDGGDPGTPPPQTDPNGADPSDPQSAWPGFHTIAASYSSAAEAYPSMPAAEPMPMRRPSPCELAMDPRPVIVAAPHVDARGQVVELVSVQQGDDDPFADYRTTASGLRYRIEEVTDGPPALAGCYIDVRYTVWNLDDELLVDDAEQSFVMANGEAIRAFDEGLAGIREGEFVSLLVPRGHSANGILPGLEAIPDEPFVIDVQVVAVRPGVSYIIEQQGVADAQPIMAGDSVEFHCVIWVEGQEAVIDSTYDRDQPWVYVVGSGQFIRGLELGMVGMLPGETRLLTIPPYLAYGEEGTGPVPANAVLSIEVTLLKVDDE